jgi:hypothetical protein
MRAVFPCFIIASMLAFSTPSDPAANKPTIPQFAYERTPRRLERGKYLVEGLTHLRCHQQDSRNTRRRFLRFLGASPLLAGEIRLRGDAT